MAQQLNPYITFNGNCAEAMEFYGRVLGGTVTSTSFRESGMDADGVMHAAVETPTGFHIFASDTMEGMAPYNPGTNIQISLSGDDADALRGYWDGLSEGGQVIVPLEKQMWGDVYGALVDQFGINWHVNIAGSAAG